MSFRWRPLSRQASLRTDPPDHADMGDLHERSVGRNRQFGDYTSLAEIAHGAVVNDPGAAIRAEPDVRWTIEPACAAHERLVTRVVIGKPHTFELKRFLLPAEVEEFDLVSDFRRPIRRGKAEVTLKCVQRGA